MSNVTFLPKPSFILINGVEEICPANCLSFLLLEFFLPFLRLISDPLLEKEPNIILMEVCS